MNVYEIITKQIIDRLEQGVIPWQKTWKGSGKHPRNFASNRRYNGINVFLLAMQGYSSCYWLTFNQVKKLGGKVRKGEKSSVVTFWKPYEKKIKNTSGEEEIRRSAFLRYYRVFNIEQCDGIDFELEEDLNVIDFQPIEQCEKTIKEMPNKPDVTHRKQKAAYYPSDDRVNMPKKNSFISEEEYYSTLFHELTHATGHESRLDRHRIDKCSHLFGSKDYSKEELVAEMGAAFLSGHCNIEQKTIDNSAAYIKGWVKKFKDHPKMVVQAAAKAQKSTDYILNRLEDQEEKNVA